MAQNNPAFSVTVPITYKSSSFIIFLWILRIFMRVLTKLEVVVSGDDDRYVMLLIIYFYQFHWFSYIFEIFCVHQGKKNLNKCSKNIWFTGRNCEVPHGKMYSATVETKAFFSC